MQPAPERSEQVVARVVAWHNRHLLAERIGARHVCGIGVVSLPFAVLGARLLPDPADATEPVADEPPAAEEAPVIEAADVVPPVLCAELPPRPARWHPRTWWQRLCGTAPFHPLFSEDLMPPLRPGRVGRWVAAHGIGARPLEAQTPRRGVALDPRCRRRGDPAAEVDLHAITAAIELGDVRKRVLLAAGADGAILGERHWSRARQALAGGAGSALLTLGALLATGLDAPPAAPGPAATVADAASAAVPEAEPAPPAAAASTPASASSVATAPAPAPAPASAAGDTPQPPAPLAAAASTPRRIDRITLAPLVPRLSDADRRAMRAQAHKLREQSAAPPRAWALVAAPLADRRQSERITAQMQAVVGRRPATRAETMRSGTAWRAVVWPFRDARDAEQVRVALAGRGLRTELIEF